LAPDIVEMILDGRQPADLTLAKLMTSFPGTWAAQRQAFGIDRRAGLWANQADSAA